MQAILPAILWQTRLSASLSLSARTAERNLFWPARRPIILDCHVERSETSLAVAAPRL